MTLGTLERVDLRSVWTHEASDFTPWLAKEDNLAALGRVLGLDLELEGTEQGVGPYSADIVCKDTVSDRYVLIENQLEKTDHGHLGQLITYAAGLDAYTVVWIAAAFNEQHRAALDWLNERTAEGVNFFGLEIELWRIGESNVAPKFNVVSKPNDWTKQIAKAAKVEAGVTDLKRQQERYWKGVAECLRGESSRVTPRTPRPQHWADYAIGRSDFHLTVTISSWEDRIEAGLYIKGPEAEAHYHLLKREADAIEREVGLPLVWDPKPDAKYFWVCVRWEGEDSTRPVGFPRQHAQIASTLHRLHIAFADRVRALDAADYTPEQDAMPSETPDALGDAYAA